MGSPRFAWGIDVGNRALKAVKLVRDGSTGGMRVDDVDVIEHEHILSDAGDNKESLIIQALNTFSQKHPEKGGAVAIGASGQSSFARFIKLPPVEDKKLPEIVRFEAIQQIPFPLDDVEWSYQIFQDEGSPEKEVGIFAMRKELVNAHIEKFTNAGLNVQAVQMNPLAVYNAMYYDQRLQKGTTMIVDVGSENTDLIIAEGEQVWLRSIPVGGNNFTEALTKQFKLKFPKAEELKRNAATSKYTRQILQAMRPVFDNLVAEIQRSIGFYASVHRDSRISRVIALGGTFRLPGLMKFLQMQLQLDVQRFDALGATPPADARVATLLNDNVLSVVAPYGLALQAMGEGKISSSLLPLAIRRERMWRDKTKWFGAAAALFVLGTGVSVGRAFYDRMQFESVATERDQIAAQVAVATDLDTKWKAVESAGEPERKQIASLQSLTKGRDLQAKIAMTIDTALPEPKPKPEGKRGERPVVLVDDMTMNYYEDLTLAVTKNESGFFSMSQADFIANAATTGGGVAAVSNWAGGRNAMAKPLVGQQPGMPMGATLPPGAVAAGSAEAAAVPGATGKQRGYLVTVTCTTPMTRWTTVAETIREALVAQTKPADPVPGVTPPTQEFRIERVEIVRNEAVKSLPPKAPRMRAPSNRRNAMNNPAAAARRNFGAYGTGMEGEFDDQGYNPGAFRQPPRPRVPGQPMRSGQPVRPVRPGQPARPGQPPVDPAAEEPILYPMPALNFDQFRNAAMMRDPNDPVPVRDPITGEDATNDNRLTFLVAVVLEPAPPAPPAPPADAIPAEGEGEAVPVSDEQAPAPSPAAATPDESASAR